jgi:hypothetical protein
MALDKEGTDEYTSVSYCRQFATKKEAHRMGICRARRTIETRRRDVRAVFGGLLG